jgi:hypothetical protein
VLSRELFDGTRVFTQTKRKPLIAGQPGTAVPTAVRLSPPNRGVSDFLFYLFRFPD